MTPYCSINWRNSDPREVLYNHQEIIVVLPENKVYIAEVETKHGWNVTLFKTDNDERSFVDESEVWPPEWWWIMGPPTQ